MIIFEGWFGDHGAVDNGEVEYDDGDDDDAVAVAVNDDDGDDDIDDEVDIGAIEGCGRRDERDDAGAINCCERVEVEGFVTAGAIDGCDRVEVGIVIAGAIDGCDRIEVVGIDAEVDDVCERAEEEIDELACVIECDRPETGTVVVVVVPIGTIGGCVRPGDEFAFVTDDDGIDRIDDVDTTEEPTSDEAEDRRDPSGTYCICCELVLVDELTGVVVLGERACVEVVGDCGVAGANCCCVLVDGDDVIVGVLDEESWSAFISFKSFSLCSLDNELTDMLSANL